VSPMNPEHRRRGARPARRLWTDGPEVVEPAPAYVAPPAEADAVPPSPGRGRRRLRRVVAGGAVALVLVGAGALGTAALRDDGAAEAPARLPAVAGGVGADRSAVVRAVYAAASPSVVSVRVERGTGAASGTGFVIDRDGTIVTNAHVVGEAQRATVRLDDNGDDVPADVVGTDPSSDLAVLRVDPDRAGALRPLPLADSDRVRVGDTAIAIGYPLGLDRTATSGIVSGLEREIQAPNGYQIDEVIQTDAPINPGNSGGPLLDARGRVIGVNSQIATAGSAGNLGIGFAVPVNTVREVVPRLQRGQTVRRAYLGVETAPAPGGPGAVVASVVAGGPAATAGLQPGDVLRRVDGRTIGQPGDVGEAVQDSRPGDRVTVDFVRGGQVESLTITLAERPQGTP